MKATLPEKNVFAFRSNCLHIKKKKKARSIYTALKMTNPCQNRMKAYYRTSLLHPVHLCSASGSLGPAANVAYNMSRLHPPSQRSRTRTTAKHLLWLHGFALHICYCCCWHSHLNVGGEGGHWVMTGCRVKGKWRPHM